MNTLDFSLLIWFGSLSAGFLGALTGLGGGVVIVPFLSVVCRVDLHYAIGASLVSVIATSSGAASAYVKEGYTNMRLGMFLEIATTFGAVAGAVVAAKISTGTIAIVFGIVLLYSAYLSRKPYSENIDNLPPDPLATRLKLNSTYPTSTGEQSYNVHGVPFGFGLMFIAGVLSGLLGIGSGALKVLAMDQIMHIPFKVSTTTSNFMIGVTAAASAGIYLNRGYIDPGLAMPVMLGVLCGAVLGARVLVRARVQLLRNIFNGVILVLALEMIYKGLTGRL
ncbi:sulfite exporter TauE/SafE family protein [Nostoc sp. TCL240-02]|uniref:sulfite exporter TauE/SafE family protein n=1 Tax=Nostoc sp. TCL240-02 TaxID=2572090 RepID=UPI00157FBD85|nr:sulfite exporter TauE/SafE family protein [Nostoc sp. TCL240-02]QKQ74069.1 sulfite exporter TauE/SafE family protein [Nostoc sp. TCL240-02]